MHTSLLYQGCSYVRCWCCCCCGVPLDVLEKFPCIHYRFIGKKVGRGLFSPWFVLLLFCLEGGFQVNRCVNCACVIDIYCMLHGC
jgi:hypothetical protein